MCLLRWQVDSLLLTQQGNPLLSTSALLQENFVLKIADRYREMCTNPKYTAQ